VNAIERAHRLLDERLAVLEARLRAGDETAWGEYVQVVLALTAALAHAAPGAGGKLVSTKELGELMGLSPKTLRRRRAKGQIKGAIQPESGGAAQGKHGSGLRWDVRAAVSGAGR